MSDSLPPTASRKANPLPIVVAQTLHRKDVLSIIRSLKTYMRNPLQCKENLLLLHACLAEGSTAKENAVKFLHASSGGIQVVLAAMENHMSDASLIETAIVLVYSISHNGSRRNIRVLSRFAKKGASKVLLAVLNCHRQTAAVFVPAAACVVSLAAVDSKIQAQSRLSGCLSTLVSVVKASTARDITASALSVLCAMCRSDPNIQALTKKGTVGFVLELLQSKMAKPSSGGSAITRFGSKLLLQLSTRVDANQTTLVNSSAVGVFLALLQDNVCIDSTKVLLELLHIVTRLPLGREEFEAAGGSSFLVQAVMQRATDTRKDEQTLEILNHLFRFHGLVELPLGPDPDAVVDYELNLTPPNPDEDHSIHWNSLSTEISAAAPHSPSFMSSPTGSASAAPANVAVNHVRPFQPPRPAPSCPSGIDYVTPVEPLYTPPPTLMSELINQMLQRLILRSQTAYEVVFDDLPRDQQLEDNPPDVSPSFSSPSLIFTSQFESGNLRRAIRVGTHEYDLILNGDINTGGHIQWFYFCVENTQPDVAYKFNIINMEKSTSMYSEGQRPLLFSEREFTSNGVGWVRAGSNIAYFANSYKRKPRKTGSWGGGGDSESDEPAAAPQPTTSTKKNTLIVPTAAEPCHFTLTFSVVFSHKNDRVYFAYNYPYTYSDLQHYLGSLKDTHPHLDDHYVNQTLCHALDGNPVNMLTITALRKDDGDRYSAEEIAARRVCVISARVHPGETNASYMMKGVIDTLLDGSNPESAYLRRTFVWKIIPMITVDGVINGNHRCSLLGRDMNREYDNPTPHGHPVIYSIKAYIQHMKTVECRNVFFYCDLHGHSRHKNFFFLGCGASKKHPNGFVLEQVFPRLLSEMYIPFRFDECRFRIIKGKSNTARVVMYKELGIRHSYTLEGSLMGGIPRGTAVDDSTTPTTPNSKPNQAQQVHYNTMDFAQMGQKLVLAVGSYVRSDSEANGGHVGEIIQSLLQEAKDSVGGDGRGGRLHRSSSLPNCLDGASGTTRNRRGTASSNGGGLPLAKAQRASSAEVDNARQQLFHFVAPQRVQSVREVTMMGLEEETFGYEDEDEDDDVDDDMTLDACDSDALDDESAEY